LTTNGAIFEIAPFVIKNMLKFDILTIFPELFEPFSKESLLKRAQQKKLLKIQAHDLRKWATDKHRSVDDKPFGGGLGMVAKVEPIFRAISTLAKFKNQKSKVILFTPRGKKFTQKMAYEFSRLDQLIMICGRYEGVDERVAKHIADVELSIGDYVLMGGELPTMTVIETVSRLIPGVVGKPAFLKERLGKGRKKGFLEYPQYTRPEIFKPKKKVTWRVPKVLLSGNHKKIEKWKKEQGKIIAG
jgi:tRNA (guanine37-N1)-methyltransferase